MKKLKVLFISLLLIAFANTINAKTVVLDTNVAMLSTQFAQDSQKSLDEDTDFIADKERFELLEAEAKALVDKFQKDQEILSDEEKNDFQKKFQDKQTELQFLANKVQTKIQEKQQEIISVLAPTFQTVMAELIAQREYEMILPRSSTLYWDPDSDITEEVIAYLNNALAEKPE
tara:strand:- start:6 stop:527 length:522 start_codon:yes stop_codon:yes gene_type:complete